MTKFERNRVFHFSQDIHSESTDFTRIFLLRTKTFKPLLSSCASISFKFGTHIELQKAHISCNFDDISSLFEGVIIMQFLQDFFKIYCHAY